VISLAGFCVVAIATLCGIIGIRTYRQAVSSAIRSTTARVDAEAEQRLLAAKDRVEQMVKELKTTSRTAIDERVTELERVYERRQSKYLKLLSDYFSTVFEAVRSLKRPFLGDQFDQGTFRGKRILWVEDEPVGIALLVQLLESCGLKIHIPQAQKQHSRNHLRITSWSSQI
jgi:hypothetical protein